MSTPKLITFNQLFKILNKNYYLPIELCEYIYNIANQSIVRNQKKLIHSELKFCVPKYMGSYCNSMYTLQNSYFLVRISEKDNIWKRKRYSKIVKMGTDNNNKNLLISNIPFNAVNKEYFIG